MANKRLQAIIKELFIRCRKLNISFAFTTQSYFKTLKDARLNSTLLNNENSQQNRVTKYCY